MLGVQNYHSSPTLYNRPLLTKASALPMLLRRRGRSARCCARDLRASALSLRRTRSRTSSRRAGSCALSPGGGGPRSSLTRMGLGWTRRCTAWRVGEWKRCGDWRRELCWELIVDGEGDGERTGDLDRREWCRCCTSFRAALLLLLLLHANADAVDSGATLVAFRVATLGGVCPARAAATTAAAEPGVNVGGTLGASAGCDAGTAAVRLPGRRCDSLLLLLLLLPAAL